MVEQLVIGEICSGGDDTVFDCSYVNLHRVDAAVYYANRLVPVLERVLVDPSIYFMGMTAGIDPRVDEKLTIMPTSPEEREELVEQLKPILSDKESEELFTEVNHPVEFSGLMRERRRLSWTPEEAIKQEKSIGDQTLTLAQALEQGGFISLSVMTWNEKERRFSPMTIIYDFMYQEMIGQGSLLSLGEVKKEFITKIEHQRLNDKVNSFRMASAMRVLAQVIECPSMENVSERVLHSTMAELDRVSEDANTLRRFILLSFELPKHGFTNAYNYYWTEETLNRVFTEMVGFKDRLAKTIPGVEFAIEEMDGVFTDWLSWKQTSKVNLENLLSRLSAIHNHATALAIKKGKHFNRALNNLETCRF